MTKKTLDFVHLLPQIPVSDADRELLRNLAGILVSHNVQQSNTLLVTKNGYADLNTGQWKEMRRKDGLRIYRERPNSSSRGRAPFTPSLLLLGTVEGTVEDMMYGVVATTDAALKIKSSSVNDGMVDTKMLCELVKPSREEPFRHVGIKWKLYNGHDYVSLDATGVLHSKNERIGYNLSHSVAFPDLPDFQSYGVLRSNMSVCSLYRQKTPTSVEIYVRGFFDFPTTNEMLNNVALQALASQWLSFGRKVEYGRLKKLMWGLRRNSLDSRTSDTSSSSSTSSSSGGGISRASLEPAMRPGACSLCSNSFGFLGTSRETCTSCGRIVCPRCTVKKVVYFMAVDGRTVDEKKSLFCHRCIENVRESDTLSIAREELAVNQDAVDT
ncbi:hypothetical protein P3T76_007664 [Phytophthora citrophthora]|uniref:FYVE-type domain-containing protein n=1 Tax=Phytophthora citrophthora TaxID=4793 RepID=A0AAD9LL89_9STRA|nr:hypothetical protein P3T76_007664 [Phytophthora citrophthora]